MFDQRWITSIWNILKLVDLLRTIYGLKFAGRISCFHQMPIKGGGHAVWWLWHEYMAPSLKVVNFDTISKSHWDLECWPQGEDWVRHCPRVVRLAFYFSKMSNYPIPSPPQKKIYIYIDRCHKLRILLNLLFKKLLHDIFASYLLLVVDCFILRGLKIIMCSAQRCTHRYCWLY